MHTHRKLIHSPPPPNLIPSPLKILQIPSQRRRITAHIHDPLRPHLHHCLQQRFLATFPRRINHNNIRMSFLSRMYLLKPPIILRQHLFRLTHIKLRILNPINPGIILCIINRLWNNLHPINLLSLLS